MTCHLAIAFLLSLTVTADAQWALFQDNNANIEVPGPSLALFANPFYTCTRNFYVNASTGNDSNTILQAQNPATPWLTIDHADTAGVTVAGDCVNVAAGVYNTNGIALSRGGNLASASGNVVYRSTTLGAAHIKQSGANSGDLVYIGANYIVFDGFEFDGNSSLVGGACFDAIVEVAGFHAHHLWILNSTLHDCGKGGVALDSGEFYYILHNLVFNTSSTNSVMGSGISVFEPVIVPSYTPTGTDLLWTPYHIVVDYNVSHDNFNPQSGPTTDGNGIILDDWQHTQNAPIVNYTSGGLVLGNITYHNGGKGVHVFGSDSVTVINNTSYNNNWDLHNTGTFRAEIDQQSGNNNTFKNNAAYTVVGAGILANNLPYFGHAATGSGNSWSNNIAFGTGGTTWVATGFDGLDTGKFSCVSNLCNSDPLWVNKASNNFALQGGSPAIAFGVSGTYFPPPPVDAGACYHSLSVCP